MGRYEIWHEIWCYARRCEIRDVVLYEKWCKPWCGEIKDVVRYEMLSYTRYGVNRGVVR